MVGTNGSALRVALYARASTDEQTHSVPGQLRELREHAGREGWRVVAEVRDEGHKRHVLDRPGVGELRELCAAGGVDEVWAWAWDRYGEHPVPTLLAVEMQGYGVALRALGDGGEGEYSEFVRFLQSMQSRQEQRQRVERGRRGRQDKRLRGEVFGGRTPRYGFSYVKGTNQKGQPVNVGYAVREETMQVVRRIFGMVAAGASLHEVQRALEGDGIPAPGGGAAWSRYTIREIVRDDVYLPRPVEEIREVVPPSVAAKLETGDAERVYGLHWAGRKKSAYLPMSEKREVSRPGREEWTAVPVDLTGSGLERATVERARERVAKNRAPSKVGNRAWELTGIVKCGECGRNMICYRSNRANGRHHHYYRCRPSSTQTPCPNRKSHRAEDLERTVLHAVLDAVKDRDELIRKADEEYERERRRLERVGGADVETWRRRLLDLDGRVARAQRAYLEGVMGLDDLKARTAEIEAEKEPVARLLEEHDGRAGELARLREKRDRAVELIKRGAWEELGITRPEARRNRYVEIGLTATVDRHGKVETRLYAREDVAKRPPIGVKRPPTEAP